MVKLISFLVFTTAFVWSWCLFHSKSPVDVNIHAGLQSKLAMIIEDAIKNARPNAYNFQMITLYTKEMEENKIGAYFSYRYSEKLQDRETSNQSVKGEAILNRTVSEDPAAQKWVIQSVKTDNSAIEFKEGSVIKSGGPPEENSDGEAGAKSSGEGTAKGSEEPAAKAATTETAPAKAAPAAVEKPAVPEEKKTE